MTAMTEFANAGNAANAERCRIERAEWLEEVEWFVSFGYDYRRVMDCLRIKPDAFWKKMDRLADDDEIESARVIRDRFKKQAAEDAYQIRMDALARRRSERLGIR